MYPFQPTQRGGWPVPLQGLTVNGKAVPISANDTGAFRFTPPNNTQSTEAVEARINLKGTVIYAPEEVVKAVYANIPGAVLSPPQNNPDNVTWEFPCNTTGIDVRFNIGGHEYAIQSRDMVVGMISDSMYGDGWSNGATPDTGRCVGAFRS